MTNQAEPLDLYWGQMANNQYKLLEKKGFWGLRLNTELFAIVKVNLFYY